MISAAAGPLIDFGGEFGRNRRTDLHKSRGEHAATAPSSRKDPWTIIFNLSPAIAPSGPRRRNAGSAGQRPIVGPASASGRGSVPPDRFEPPGLGPGPALSLPARADPRLPGERRRGRQSAGLPGACSGATTSRAGWSGSTRTTGSRARGRSKSFSRRSSTRLRIISSTPSPKRFGSRGCRRVYGLMHSRLFWRIFGELKWRWANLQSRRPR